MSSGMVCEFTQATNDGLGLSVDERTDHVLNQDTDTYKTSDRRIEQDIVWVFTLVGIFCRLDLLND